MSKLCIEERQIVIPGDILAEGMDYVPGDNTYREDDVVYAKTLGLVSLSGRVLKVTPQSGAYQFKIGDKIICRVTDILMSGWRCDTNTAYSAVMNVRDASARFIKKGEDLTGILDVGDYAVVQVTNVTSQNLIDLSMKGPDLRKITAGRIIKINPHKVPRIIGKKASMIMLLKEKTGCVITVGQNGLVWIKGETGAAEYKCEQAIKFIEERSHQRGVTQKVETFLS